MSYTGTVYYLGLEPYESRYTLQMTEWVTRAATRNNVNTVIVPGEAVEGGTEILTGQVLDGTGRGVWALTQTANLLRVIRNHGITEHDVIWLDDMFHPGYEAILYALAFREKVPRIITRCYAQSIDPDDFVHTWGMAQWMRKYEAIVNTTADAIFFANEEQISYAAAAGWNAKCYVTGLPFDLDEVRERAGEVPEWKSRPLKIVFASRWDAEKQPEQFMSLASAMALPGIEFVVLSGKALTSNEPYLVTRARSLEKQGVIRIAEGLSKKEYYDELKTSRVMVNTGLQDWVSNTANEADALGCNIVVPAYKGFPETVQHDESRLWLPWSFASLKAKTEAALYEQQEHIGRLALRSHKTLDKCFEIVKGEGHAYRRSIRSDNRYRRWVKG